MSYITCTRRIQFCAGHRVFGHETKCAHLHGHNYVLFVTAQVKNEGDLDKVGRVVDFSVLKDRVGGWIDQNWDHGFLLDRNDKGAIAALQVMSKHMTETEGRKPQKLFLMPYNPTAENMAKFILDYGPALMLGTNVEICAVRVEETENCSASVLL